MKNAILSILLVEDNMGDVLLTKRAFKHAQVSSHIDVANDGEKAMEMLSKVSAGECEFPNLILLDINLPGKSGKQVLREIKSNEALRSIPVVVLSSSKSAKDVDEMYSLHANGYLVKPPNIEKFYKMIAAVKDYWLTENIPPGRYIVA